MSEIKTAARPFAVEYFAATGDAVSIFEDRAQRRTLVSIGYVTWLENQLEISRLKEGTNGK